MGSQEVVLSTSEGFTKACREDPDLLPGFRLEHVDSLAFSEPQHGVRAIILAETKFGSAEVALFPDLEVLAKCGTGIDNVNRSLLRAENERRFVQGKKRVVLARAARVNALSVAEHVLASAIMLAHAVPESMDRLRVRQWHRPVGRCLSDLSVGIIGLGEIGSATTEIMSRLCDKLYGYNRHVLPRHKNLVRKHRLEILPDPESVLRKSDIVVVALALDSGTCRFINRERIRLMRRGSHLINVSRGETVDERALLAALESGRLAGAALDVFSTEPPFGSEELVRLIDNSRVIATAHIAGRPAMPELARATARNVLGVLEGRLTEVEQVPI